MEFKGVFNQKATAEAMRIGAYEGNSGRELAAQYESISQQELFAPIEHLLPKNPASILDIGAGSGRDDTWFARKDQTVLAVEPSETMRTYTQNLHCSSMILWLDDCLPALNKGHLYLLIQPHFFYKTPVNSWSFCLCCESMEVNTQLFPFNAHPGDLRWTNVTCWKKSINARR